MFFFMNALKISLSPASREGPFHVMFVRTSMVSESQDASKITSALADPRIYSSMKRMTLHMHINAITLSLSASPTFSSSVVTMSTSRLTGVCMTNNSYQESVLEDYDGLFLEDFHVKNGVICHDIFKNNMLVMRSSPHLRLLRSSPHL